jgi:hypothetical protein
MAMACVTVLVGLLVHESREDKRVTRQLNLVEWRPQ